MPYDTGVPKMLYVLTPPKIVLNMARTPKWKSTTGQRIEYRLLGMLPDIIPANNSNSKGGALVFHFA